MPFTASQSLKCSRKNALKSSLVRGVPANFCRAAGVGWALFRVWHGAAPCTRRLCCRLQAATKQGRRAVRDVAPPRRCDVTAARHGAARDSGGGPRACLHVLHEERLELLGAAHQLLQQRKGRTIKGAAW